MTCRSAIAVGAFCLASLGCSHELQIKNLNTYNTPLHLGTVESTPAIAIVPFAGTEDDLFFFNDIVERLSQDPGIGDVRTDYIARLARRGGFEPDLIVDVKTKVDYRSSGWNFLINWPGFLIFTPAWNGYVYHADVRTTFVFLDANGSALDQLDVPMSFSIRHADMDRTIFTGLTWLEVSLLAFGGGIYNANSFDRDVIPPFHTQVKDTYANYVLAQAQQRVRSLVTSGALQRKPIETAPEAPAPSTNPTEPSGTPPTPSTAPAPAPP